MSETKDVDVPPASAAQAPPQPSSPSHRTTSASPSPSQPSNKRKRSSSPPTAPAIARSASRDSKEGSPQSSTSGSTSTNAPPLPTEAALPPLPLEPLPSATTTAISTSSQTPQGDDGWAPVWDAAAQTYYFYNRFTQATQWENPRVPSSIPSGGAPGTSKTATTLPISAPPGTTAAALPATGTANSVDEAASRIRPAAAGGYNPTIHGDYDPNADYAQAARAPSPPAPRLPLSGAIIAPGTDPNDPSTSYSTSAHFNRFTGRFQNAAVVAPENFSDENKSRRQMNAYFDVDAAANSHDGRSLKAERAGKKLSKSEVKAFRERRKEKKEEKRRAWLRD